jgi:hypothetical protein
MNLLQKKGVRIVDILISNQAGIGFHDSSYFSKDKLIFFIIYLEVGIFFEKQQNCTVISCGDRIRLVSKKSFHKKESAFWE